MFTNWIRTLLNYKVKYKKTTQKKDVSDIDFKLLRKVFDKFPLKDGYIDDITWNDLEMNKVFAKLNRTYTLSGEELLYYWMKTPTLNSNDFLKREEKLKHVKASFNQLLKELKNVGTYDYDYRDVILNNQPDEKSDKKPLFLYSSLLIMLLSFSLTNSGIFLFGISCSLMLIILFHYFYMMNNKYKVSTFDYIVRIATFYTKNTTLIKDIYSEEYDLNKMSLTMEQIVIYKDSFNVIEGANPLKDIADVLTLSIYRKSLKMEKLVFLNKNDILGVSNILGEIDLSQAIIQYKKDNMTSQPHLSEDMNTLVMDESYNLLIDDCVHNDVEIMNSIVITGSNMGGKSSFLRQIGINIILGQSFCFSLSRNHAGGFFKILSSISLNDDIESGKSYFLKEAEAIQRMLNHDDGRQNTLILIDEIFKGTNPVERLAASVEILNRLSGKNKVIVTTHDISILTDLVDFEFYHFEHEISKTKMAFDFKIKKGITEVRNAVKLMEYIEYPKELIKSINDRIIQMNSIV